MIQYSINLLKRLNRLVSPVPVYVKYFSQTVSSLTVFSPVLPSVYPKPFPLQEKVNN